MIFLLILLGIVALFITGIGQKIVSSILSSAVSLIIQITLFVLGAVILFNAAIWVINNILLSLLIAVVLLGIVFLLGYINEQKDKEYHSSMLIAWENIPTQSMTNIDILQFVEQFISPIEQSDSNPKKFTSDIPYGRVTYFVNYFDHDLENQEVLYFSPIRSKTSDELREYGCIVTTAGIYFSNQLDKTDSDGNFKVEQVFIGFSGMIGSTFKNDTLKVYYTEYSDYKEIEQKSTTVNLSLINEVCNQIISTGVSKSIHKEQVYDYVEIADKKEEEFLNKNFAQNMGKVYQTAGVSASIPNMNKVHDEIGYNMNQRQGHGTAAEYGNTAIDRMMGRKVVHAGGDNAKDGADRIVQSIFGGKEIQIQSKYCKTARATVNDAFASNHNYDFKGGMKLEVPKDQYTDSVKILNDKIKKWESEGTLEEHGLHKGQKAENILRKGHFTYDQASNIQLAGSVEGIMVDTMQGIYCSVGAGSISAILTFVTCKWNDIDTKTAAIESMKVGIKTIGKSTAIYVITAQLSREKTLSFINKGVNPFYKLSEGLANKISKSSIGTKFGLKNLTSKKIISGAVTAVITFGPDIARALTGRISGKQLIKNSAIGGAGIAGAAIGQAVIPIPIVGAMIGGAVSGFIAKKSLDKFIEDDAIEMYAVLKEEFMDAIPLAGLNSEEFQKVSAITIANPKLPSVLRDMYAYGDAREYAKEHIMDKAIQNMYSNRQVITNDEYMIAMDELISESIG